MSIYALYATAYWIVVVAGTVFTYTQIRRRCFNPDGPVSLREQRVRAAALAVPCGLLWPAVVTVVAVFGAVRAVASLWRGLVAAVRP